MELQQLRGFCEVARQRSFTRAADKLFLTQPAVSLQLKALEGELGVALLERGRRQLRLTPAGEVLLRRAQEALQVLESARDEIAGLEKLVRGRLIVGTSDTNCTYILPEVLRAFRTAFPHVELEIRNRMSLEAVRLVLADEVDFGLVTLPVRHRDLVQERLFARRDVLICPPDHPLARRRQVGLAAVAEHPLLALERGSVSRQLMDEAFRQAGVSPVIAMDLGAVEVIKRFVEIGLGVALVPEVTVREEVRQGRLAQVLVTGLGKRAIGLIEHRGRQRSRAAEAFLQALRQHVAAAFAGGDL
ncbi:MAG: LysR family transcriptional regulator [Candidatus Latescibacterota bacterium]